MNPLASYPELSVLIPAEGVVEFRVENWRLRKGSRVPGKGPELYDFTFAVLIIWGIWYKVGMVNSFNNLCSWLCIVLLYLYMKCTRVLHESIVVLRPYGIQLETQRGITPPFVKALPLTARRRFIPFTSIHYVAINEGLRRWDVRYYLCVIGDAGSKVEIGVAFENILPRLPILKFVYNEIRDLMEEAPVFPVPASEVDGSR